MSKLTLNAVARPANLTLADQVYGVIRREILTCRLKPGQVVSESAIAAQLRVSKSTVQNALKLLAQDELVTAIPSIGHAVTRVTLDDVRDYHEMRCVVEGEIVERAAQRITDAQLAELDTLAANPATHLDYTRDDDETRMAWHENNVRFHMYIADVADNRRLRKAMGSLMDEQLRLSFIRQRPSTGLPLASEYSTAHREILEALRRRDGEQARRLSVQDLEMYLHNLEALLPASDSQG